MSVSSEYSLPEQWETTVVPLVLLNKDLPLTPGSEMVTALERENQSLRREICCLRSQLDVWINQVKKYRRIAKASKTLVKSLLCSIQGLQEGVEFMEETERAATEEWTVSQASMEQAVIWQGGLGNMLWLNSRNPVLKPPISLHGSESDDCVNVWFLARKLNRIMLPILASIFLGSKTKSPRAPTVTWKSAEVNGLDTVAKHGGCLAV